MQLQRPFFSNFIILLLLAAVVFGLYGHNLDGYWRGDDTSILLHALRHPLLDIFISPAAWQELSSANLTPLVSLSFYVDYLLAGLNPRFFYAHQLMVISLIGFMTYLLLSSLIRRSLATGGALLVLLGTPMVTVSAQLMTRHYAEGLLLSLVSLYFFLLSQQQEKRRYFWLALCCYILAVTAKETYVPLGVLLVLLIIQKGEEYIERILPLVLTMAGYVAWRLYMLPEVVGGYAGSADIVSVSYIVRALQTFLTIPSILLGSYSAVMALVFLGSLVFLSRTHLEQGLLMLLIAGLILLPMLPLVAFPGIKDPDRYLLLPWYASSFAWVFVIGKLSDQSTPIKENRVVFFPVAVGVVVCSIAAMFIHQQGYRVNVAAFNAKADTQIRFFWEHDQNVAFIPDNNILANFWLVQSSRELKELVMAGASSPGAVVDDMFLDQNQALFEYSAECSCMSDISATVAARMAALNVNNHNAAPLSLLMTNTNGLVSWEFGPYTTGAYHIVSTEMGSLVMPFRQNNLRTNYRREVAFYLKYIAPEGWVSYSPQIRIHPDGVPVVWARE